MRVEHRGGDKFDIDIRGHVVRVDQPVKDRGEDTAPTPTELFIASMAHRISPWLARVGKRFNQACGGVFIAIGAALPLRS